MGFLVIKLPNYRFRQGLVGKAHTHTAQRAKLYIKLGPAPDIMPSGAPRLSRHRRPPRPADAGEHTARVCRRPHHVGQRQVIRPLSRPQQLADQPSAVPFAAAAERRGSHRKPTRRCALR